MTVTIENQANNANLFQAWQALKEDNPKLRIRNAAARLGVSEAELLATKLGDTVRRLKSDWSAILHDLEEVGDVMALTRNDHVVHEKHGVYRDVSVNGPIGLVLDEEIDLRIFLRNWHVGFVVRQPLKSGWRHSLQFFDAHGQAVHKIFRTEQTNGDAWDALVERHLSEEQSSDLKLTQPQPPTPETPDAEIDVEGFQKAWTALEDTHEFFGMLNTFGVTRTQALRLAPEGMAIAVEPNSLRQTLEAMAAQEVPIMVFVGSRGVIQIHSGPVKRLVTTGPWFNVLDPRFNLHLREAAIANAWVVRKPTVDGVVSSLELFSASGETIAMLFGKRKPGIPENPQWRAFIDGLAGEVASPAT